ncbi:MAG: hypothetical protein JWQ53_620, partial [Klenkia sp.]|nr:hypothetical protein [Klenkia sp.]
WAGALGHALTEVGRLAAAPGEAWAAGVGVAMSAALVAAALFLESTCRVPAEPEDRS